MASLTDVRVNGWIASLSRKNLLPTIPSRDEQGARAAAGELDTTAWTSVSAVIRIPLLLLLLQLPTRRYFISYTTPTVGI